MIDLQAVQSLRAVATSGSVVAAAEALGFTPSAVSQQIKRLERQTGVTLLERAGRGVVLSDRGRSLVADSARVLADLEEVEANLQLSAGVVAGEVRLAAFSTAVRGLVAHALGDVRRAHPQLRVTLEEREPWETTDLVASGQVDLGVVHRWGGVPLAMPDHLTEVHLFTDVADVVVHAGHRLAGRAWVTPRDLAEEDWIATYPNTICRQWLNRMFDGVGRPPRVTFQSMEFASHLELARHGLGVALVPRLGRTPLGEGLAVLEVREPAATRDVVALHRRSLAPSPALQALVDVLRDRALSEFTDK